MELDNFAFGDYKLNGRVVQDVRGPITPDLHSIRLEFTNLEITEPHATTVVNGVVEDVQVNDVTGNRRTITGNFLERNVRTGEEIWAENLVRHSERTFYYAFDHSFSGRMYHSVYGYVDVSSDLPLTFISNEASPDRGGALRVRGANGSAGMIAVNRDYAAVVLDDDGNGVDDRFYASQLGRAIAGRAAAKHSLGCSRTQAAGARSSLERPLSSMAC
jgi:hypothetical protein